MSIPTAKIVSKNIMRILEGRGKNLNWLAETTGISVNAAYDIKRSGFNPKIGTLEKIAQALEVPVALFFDDTEESFFQKKPDKIPKNHVLYVGILPKFQAFLMRKYDKKDKI